jgi:hypothetical protein
MTEQPTNPLVAGKSAKSKGPVTLEMLHDLVERSNRKAWVIASGQPYFVNRRWEEATEKTPARYVHFLDRLAA